MILFAQISMNPSTASVVGYVLLTLAFLSSSAFILLMRASLANRLMLLGILVAAAANGYATLVAFPSESLVVPTLMKISVILVLGSVTSSFTCRTPYESESREKGATDV